MASFRNHFICISCCVVVYYRKMSSLTVQQEKITAGHLSIWAEEDGTKNCSQLQINENVNCLSESFSLLFVDFCFWFCTSFGSLLHRIPAGRPLFLNKDTSGKYAHTLYVSESISITISKIGIYGRFGHLLQLNNWSWQTVHPEHLYDVDGFSSAQMKLKDT